MYAAYAVGGGSLNLGESVPMSTNDAMRDKTPSFFWSHSGHDPAPLLPPLASVFPFLSFVVDSCERLRANRAENRETEEKENKIDLY